KANAKGADGKDSAAVTAFTGPTDEEVHDMFCAGLRLFRGKNGAPSGEAADRSAIEWFTRAGDPSVIGGDSSAAQCYRAGAHLKGLCGLPVDVARAKHWFELSGGVGDSRPASDRFLSSLNSLGSMHLFSIEPKDERKALDFFREAADAGHPTAQHNL